jgi:hypothetical protein
MKKTFRAAYIYINVIIILIYVCNYMAPVSVMNYVNDPYSNEWLLLLFGNCENYNVPFTSIEFSTLYIFTGMCMSTTLMSIYKYIYEK